jgi:hypothetical protein
MKRSVDDVQRYEEGEGAAYEQSMLVVSDHGGRSEVYFGFGGSETATCLTRELETLPMAAREKVGQDLYGLSESVPIDAGCFEQLTIELEKVKEKTAYDRALELSPHYVQNRSFRLMFLRATQGDVKLAAKRMARHFSTKLSLFGEPKLVKDIQLSDLDEYDMEALRSGGFQVLPHRDLAGRTVLFGRYTVMRYREIKNMVSELGALDCYGSVWGRSV